MIIKSGSSINSSWTNNHNPLHTFMSFPSPALTPPPSIDEIVQDVVNPSGPQSILTLKRQTINQDFLSSTGTMRQPKSPTPPNHNIANNPVTSSNNGKVALYLLRNQRERPQITLSYCQTIDGCILESGLFEPLIPPKAESTIHHDQLLDIECLSESEQLLQRLRFKHDALLLNGDLLAAFLDRYDQYICSFKSCPALIVVNPKVAALLASLGRLSPSGCQIIVLTKDPEAFSECANIPKVHVIKTPINENGLLDVESLLEYLYSSFPKIRKVLVEATDANILRLLLIRGLFDKLVITIKPQLRRFYLDAAVESVDRNGTNSSGCPDNTEHVDVRLEKANLSYVKYEMLGRDLIATAEPVLDM